MFLTSILMSRPDDVQNNFDKKDLTSYEIEQV